MFTMAKVRIGVTYLDEHLVQNDYYSENEKVVGEWYGRAAERLGIDGNPIEAGDEAFERLRGNFHPVTGEKLTPRTKDFREASFIEARESLIAKWRYEGKDGEPSSTEVETHRLTMPPVPNRVAFYDFQCGAPKSVSVMALVAGDERLRTAHAESVKVALRELECFAACRGKEILGRLKRHEFTGEICAALFEHDTSRSLDPQLHTHCVVANATWDKSRQRWSALTEFEMVQVIRYVGKVYQNELASRVKALGYEIRDEHDKKGNVTGWKIEGVPQKVCEEFSQRRRDIEAGIDAFRAKYGRHPSTAEIGVITRETRSKKLDKSDPRTVQQVRDSQRARLRSDQLSALKKLSESAIPRDRGSRKEKESLVVAVSHGFERASVKKAHAILADALNAALGAADLEQLKRALVRGDADTHLLADNSENPLVAEFATKEGVKTEEWAVTFVNATNGKFAPLAHQATLEKDRLSDEQYEAVEFICRSRNQVVAVRGVAGAGKTTMLKALDRQLRAAGREMLYLAPTASAVKMLEREGFENATTVDGYLTQSSRRPWTSAVLVIDEAGLQSNRQGAEVLALAQKHRQRIVFVGDSRQHVSVEAGDFLRILETHSRLESRELKNIRRQIAEDYRQAIVAMAEGKTALGMEQLDAMGWIHEKKGDYLHEAARAWLARSDNGKKADDVVCVAPTWEENFTLSREIRDGLKTAGRLGESVNIDVVHSLKWTAEQKRRLAQFVQKNPDLVVTPTSQLPGLIQARSYRIEGVQAGGLLRLEGGYTLDPQRSSRRFDVGILRQMEIAQGDQLLVRMNDKARGLVNGQVVTVDSIRSDGSVLTRCGIEISSSFRQFTHGYVVTSHKAQGRTARHVIVAGERLDSKGAYVGCSRGRESCDVFTVDKERLFAALPFNGNRRAALDVLQEQRRAARQDLVKPDSVMKRIKTAATAAVRHMMQAGNQLRTQAAFARQQWEKRTKPRTKAL
jgi:conjugative relaxase-like TrwC/TraI family protein